MINMKKNVDINERICDSTIVYVIIMLVAVAISTFTEIGISICWIVNFIGGIVILFKYIKMLVSHGCHFHFSIL